MIADSQCLRERLMMELDQKGRMTALEDRLRSLWINPLDLPQENRSAWMAFGIKHMAKSGKRMKKCLRLVRDSYAVTRGIHCTPIENPSKEKAAA